MISKASVEFIRISPRKVRYVIDMIRKKSVNQAQAILNGSPRRASDILRKLLNQAVDAATRNSNADSNNLFVSKVLADGGPTMRRFRAASMGRASVIRKRTSHIYLELDSLKKTAESSLKTQPAVSPKVEKVKSAPGQAKKAAPKKTVLKKMAGAK